MQERSMMFPRAFSLGLLVCIMLAMGAARLSAQATSGAITGVVSDQTGAVAAGAAVTVRHLETNATRAATTEADGRFNFAGLPVGPYELTVELSGFAKYVRTGIVLLLNQVAVINPELKPAASWAGLPAAAS